MSIRYFKEVLHDCERRYYLGSISRCYFMFCQQGNSFEMQGLMQFVFDIMITRYILLNYPNHKYQYQINIRTCTLADFLKIVPILMSYATTSFSLPLSLKDSYKHQQIK